MNDRIKDYFAFNKKEQRGLIVLLGLLLLSVLFNFMLPYLIPEKEFDIRPFKKEVEEFMASLEQADTVKQKVFPKSYPKKNTYEEDKNLEAFLSAPFVFDPNELSEDQWIEMEMPGRITGNIMRFRDKGGRFYDKDGLRKIYGMNDALFAILAPYIEIKKVEKKPADKKHSTSYYSDSSEKNKSEKIAYRENKVQIELNSADSIALLGFHGIGPSFAGRIIKYRDRLGGFYKPEQLLEIRGMDSSRLDQFKDQVSIDTSIIKKMDLNTVTFKELLRHPYFEYYLVKAIFNKKDEIKTFDSVEQVRYLPVMYEELYEKIAPYLDVSGFNR